MFRKIKSGASAGPAPQAAFDDGFWQWYNDSYTRAKSHEIDGLLKPNPKKYSASSASVQLVVKYFELARLPVPSVPQVVAMLKSPFTQGDILKTFYMIRFYQVSGDGLFITNEGMDKLGHPIRFVGAENWENVMCYLDALLFSMFANLESFEPMLFLSNQHNYLTNQLAGLLRVYVNLLRSGNLITTDLTMRICEGLKKLGFDEAMSHKQQDSATLFEFLTEVLAMPLLTFKIDIKHGGKMDKDDLKYSKERILFVSLPDEDLEEAGSGNGTEWPKVEPKSPKVEPKFPKTEPSSKPEDEDDDAILLEECLEHYFNNSISVKRELERRATLESIRAHDSIPEDPQDVSETRRRPMRSDSKANSVRLHVRTRSSTLSLWSVADGDPDSPSSSKPREVSLPAWMFLRLLPFYTDDNDLDSSVKNSMEFVNRRPIVPICLKRYSFNAEKSQANRSQKRIIIPPIINLPSFVADDVNDSISGDYKLILESALCHRGTSISSGHFVSAIRKNTNNVSESDDEAHSASWYLYDDMKKKSRVVEKSFKEIFDSEWPYMLFYRLVANDPEATGSAASSVRNLGPSNSSSSSSLVIPPKGSKSKFWIEKPEETLSPILSVGSSANASSASANASSTLGLDHNLRSEDLQSMRSTTSIPIPEITPMDAQFLDIRKKYYWYLTDKNKNYYKELPTLSKSGTRDMSVSLSPQFRRNSQWSDTSNTSVLNLDFSRRPSNPVGEDLAEVDEKLHNLQLSQTNSQGSSKWKLPFSNRNSKSNVGSPDITTPNSHPTDLHRTISPIDLTGEKEEPDEKKHHHHHHHLNSILSGDQSKKKKHKKHLKRRDDYRKEKCTIV